MADKAVDLLRARIALGLDGATATVQRDEFSTKLVIRSAETGAVTVVRLARANTDTFGASGEVPTGSASTLHWVE